MESIKNISESEMIKSIRYAFVKHYYETGKLHIDDVLVYAATLMAPYLNEIQYTKQDDNSYQKQGGHIEPIVKQLKKNFKNRDFFIEEQSILVELFRDKWLPKLDFKTKTYLIQCFSYIQSIERDGYVTLKSEQAVWAKLLAYKPELEIKVNNIDSLIGTVPEAKKSDINQDSSTGEAEPPILRTNPITTTDTNSSHNSTLALTTEYIINTLQKNSDKKKHNSKNNHNEQFEKLYDQLLQAHKFTEENVPKYVWQWLLTKDEYDQICACINNNNIPTSGKINKKTAQLLLLYLGEYYKREYYGNKNNIAKPCLYKKILELLNIKVLSTKKKDAPMFTLYVQGGLPIHQIAEKLKDCNYNTGYFIKALKKLINPQNNTEKSDGESLLKKATISDTVCISYDNNESIYEYIQACNDINLKTWADNDNGIDDFTKFSKIKEAIRIPRSKFRLSYTMWVDKNSFTLYPTLNFKPEFNGERHYAISPNFLKLHSITNYEKGFTLLWGNKETEKLYYYPVSNGRDNEFDYISHQLITEIPLLAISQNDIYRDKISDLPTIKINETDISKSVEHSLSQNGYLQFYTNEDTNTEYGCLWSSSKGNKEYQWSALLFDNQKFIIADADEASMNESNIKIKQLSNDYSWIEFQYFATLQDKKGKTTTKRNNPDEIYAIPTLHKLVNNPQIKSVLSNGVICSNKRLCYLVPNVKINFTYIDGETELTQAEKDKVRVEFQQGTNTKWYDYSTTELSQGYVRFTVYYKNAKTYVDCFVLNKDAEIKIVANTLRFYGFDLDQISPSLTRKSSGIDKTEYLEWNNTQNQEPPTIDFTIGDCQKNYIKLTLYYPKPIILSAGQNLKKIPLIFVEKNKLKKISSTPNNKEFVETSFDFCEERKGRWSTWLRSGLLQTALDAEPNQELSLFSDENAFPEYKICRYTHKIDDAGILTNININFCFLSFDDNSVEPIDKKIIQNMFESGFEKEGLLFQDMQYINPQYVLEPKYIPSSSKKEVLNKNYKREQRSTRLTNYKNEKIYAKDYAIQQFLVAGKYNLYYAIFDTLACMIWDSKTQKIVPKNNLDKNVFRDFIVKYSEYIQDKNELIDFEALRRLGIEFSINWTDVLKNWRNAPESINKNIKELKNNLK